MPFRAFSSASASAPLLAAPLAVAVFAAVARADVSSDILSKVETDANSIGRKLAADDDSADDSENKIALGSALSSGNTESGGATAMFEARQKFGKAELRAAFDAAYEEQRLRESETGRRYDERTKGNSKATAHVERRLSGYYAFAAAAGMNDDVSKVRFRAVETGGVGTYLCDERGVSASVEIGPAAIQQKLADDRDSFHGVRAAERLEWKPEGKSMRVWQGVEAIWDAPDPGRAIYSGHLGAEAPLAGGFSLLAKASADYDTEPAEGAEKADCKFSAMLAYTF